MKKENALKYLSMLEEIRIISKEKDHDYRVIEAIVSKYYGYGSRSEWVDALKESEVKHGKE